MSYRIKHWSCGPFATWLQKTLGGEAKPHSATMQGWVEWKQTAEAKNKFVYNLTEKWLDNVQDVIYWPLDKLDDARTYCQNRFGDKMHYLPTRLKPGKYYEVDTRILHGLFETLVDFVEVESAWMSVVFDDEAMKAYYPWYQRYRWLRFKRFRSPELGLKHLDWAISLGDESPRQAAKSKVIKELYLWWKNERKNRKDSWEESGLRGFYDEMKKKYGGGILGMHDKFTEAEHAMWQRMHDNEQVILDSYAQEDEDKMIQLIKLRHDLWT